VFFPLLLRICTSIELDDMDADVQRGRKHAVPNDSSYRVHQPKPMAVVGALGMLEAVGQQVNAAVSMKFEESIVSSAMPPIPLDADIETLLKAALKEVLARTRHLLDKALYDAPILCNRIVSISSFHVML
jgi:hypothetical protein